MVEERGSGSGICAVATRSDRPHQDRSRGLGQYRSQGASGRNRGSKKNGPQAIGKSRGGWTTKIHMVAADARTAITFALSPGQAHDAPEGRKLLRHLGKAPSPLHLIMVLPASRVLACRHSEAGRANFAMTALECRLTGELCRQLAEPGLIIVGRSQGQEADARFQDQSYSLDLAQ